MRVASLFLIVLLLLAVNFVGRLNATADRKEDEQRQKAVSDKRLNDAFIKSAKMIQGSINSFWKCKLILSLSLNINIAAKIKSVLQAVVDTLTPRLLPFPQTPRASV